MPLVVQSIKWAHLIILVKLSKDVVAVFLLVLVCHSSWNNCVWRTLRPYFLCKVLSQCRRLICLRNLRFHWR
jgi:hypothetical protein